MKFTLSWLKQHLETDADLTAIVETLTKIGLEVEDVHDPAASLTSFVIASVIEAQPHPNAQPAEPTIEDAYLAVLAGRRGTANGAAA